VYNFNHLCRLSAILVDAHATHVEKFPNSLKMASSWDRIMSEQ